MAVFLVSSPEPCLESPLEVSLSLLSYRPLQVPCLDHCLFAASVGAKHWLETNGLPGELSEISKGTQLISGEWVDEAPRLPSQLLLYSPAED